MAVEIVDNQNKIALTDDYIEYIERGTRLILDMHQIEKEPEITLVFCDDEEIHQLNFQYRHMNKATDVLSFPQYDSLTAIQETIRHQNQQLPLLLGDIIISLETAVKQSQEYGHSLTREIIFLYVHGLLHLLGYDHLEDEDLNKMRDKEREIMNLLALAR